MNAWRSYWQGYGILNGLFTAFMAVVIVLSGLGMVGGIAWMWWDAPN